MVAARMPMPAAPLPLLPPLGADGHAHLFEPARFPYRPDRRYTPPPATLEDLLAMHARLGLQRVVLVQPSVYGSDNACLLAALDRLGDRARGVAVIDEHTPTALLRSWHARGVRGVRLNFQVWRSLDAAPARAALIDTAARLGDLPWLVQIHAALPLLVALAPTLAALERPVLIDHFGLAQAALGPAQAGFAELLALLGYRHVHVKLSGPYQISTQSPHYGEVAAIARALHRAAPDRCVWGSDWPHPGGANRAPDARPEDIEPFREEDDAAHLARLAQWLETPTALARVLVSTPARLFDFPG